MGMSIQLIKNRSDIGAGTRGSDVGIDALEIAAINSGNDFFHKHDYVDVPTRNETIYHKKTNTFAKRIEHVAEQCERVAAAVQVSITSGHTPIVLSGDHSSALGTISGLKAAFPDKQLGVIWIDAHSDIHSPYTSPSGNIHGMPLAAALAEDNLSCQINYPEK
ncbi:MAG: arginase family protein, partial [Chitinophagaceae bacterium]|nr:arginase family protein [Chitinophagaceae bacterium]